MKDEYSLSVSFGQINIVDSENRVLAVAQWPHDAEHIAKALNRATVPLDDHERAAAIRDAFYEGYMSSVDDRHVAWMTSKSKRTLEARKEGTK